MFDHVDKSRKGWLSFDDLLNFLKDVNGPNSINFPKLERAYRRIDEDKDRKLNYNEFLRAVRPIYLYPTYSHYKISNCHEVEIKSPIIVHTSPLRRSKSPTRRIQSSYKKLETIMNDSLNRDRFKTASCRRSKSPRQLSKSPYRSPYVTKSPYRSPYVTKSP